MKRVTQGRIVRTQGPWSNGHGEQAAMVTHVYGDGSVSPTLVNLHVFVDLGQPMIANEVPWYESRNHAIAALAADLTKQNGGANACWFPERDDE